MISALSNSMSALRAFGKKMGVIADNVANAHSEGFKKSRALLQEGDPGGVRAAITQVNTPGAMVVDGEAEGMPVRELSNVHLEEEIPQVLLTEKLFAVNVKVVKTEEEMVGSVLDILG